MSFGRKTWDFVYFTEEEIIERLEKALELRATVKQRKRIAAKASEDALYYSRDFESVAELAEYAADLHDAGKTEMEAREKRDEAERERKRVDRVLSRILPPGSHLNYTAKDGQYYSIFHTRSPHEGIQIRRKSKPKSEATGEII